MHIESSGENQPYIVLPDEQTIKERLELVSSDQSFRDHVIPRMMELAEVRLQPIELVESLEVKLSEYADERMLGIKTLALADMEAIISNLVDDEKQRKSTINCWSAAKIDKITQNGLSEAELRKARRGYSQPKFPRRRKKNLKKRRGLY